MNLMTKLPTSRLGKASLLFVGCTLIAWLFVNNAQNCLSRDFVEQAPPAVCWRATNDYETTIALSQTVFLTLLVFSIVLSSAALTAHKIKKSHATTSEIKRITLFLAILSVILLIFIVTTFEVWQRTTYNNNNYFLNTTTDVVVKLGLPVWLVISTASFMYGLKYLRISNG